MVAIDNKLNAMQHNIMHVSEKHKHFRSNYRTGLWFFGLTLIKIPKSSFLFLVFVFSMVWVKGYMVLKIKLYKFIAIIIAK